MLAWRPLSPRSQLVLRMDSWTWRIARFEQYLAEEDALIAQTGCLTWLYMGRALTRERNGYLAYVDKLAAERRS